MEMWRGQETKRAGVMAPAFDLQSRRAADGQSQAVAASAGVKQQWQRAMRRIAGAAQPVCVALVLIFELGPAR